jgi:hypothetical protein
VYAHEPIIEVPPGQYRPVKGGSKPTGVAEDLYLAHSQTVTPTADSSWASQDAVVASSD